MQWRRMGWGLGLVTTIALVGMAPAGALDRPELWQQLLQRSYRQAVQDAVQAEPSEIEPLLPIVPTTSQLRWRTIAGEPHVLLVTWTNWDGYDNLVGQKTTLSREVWTTPVPEVQNFVKKEQPSADILSLRLEQFLGLPPNNGKTKWVEMWVRPGDLFRPCPDAEITDTRCDLAFPANVTPEHRRWVVDLDLSSYGDRGYPWTRLGYTYDWGSPTTDRGADELVVRSGSPVWIEQVKTNADYFPKTPITP